MSPDDPASTSLLMPAFRRDPAVTRQLGLGDLVFACLIAFGLVPAFSYAIGSAPFLLMPSGEADPLWMMAGVLAGFGYSGMFAWIATPLALLAGWWALRTGFLGWATALVCGMLAGAVCSLPFIGGTFVRLLGNETLPIIAAFTGLGALYGVIAYAALCWLRADVLKAPS